MTTARKLLATAVLLVVLVVGAGVWWFLRDDAPAEADLATAAQAVQDEATTTAAGDGGTAASDATTATTTADGIEGTWTVDTETGEFSYEEATGTFAGFRIAEELSSIGSTTAVGRTGDVSGEATIEGTALTAATFDVDLTTIATETSMRDDKVQSALETSDFPTATFTVTEPIELGDAATSGDPLTVTAAGEMTIHGVTQEVTFEIEAQLVDDTIVLVATTDVTFSDYGVEVPSSPAVVSVDDHGIVEAQILLVR